LLADLRQLMRRRIVYDMDMADRVKRFEEGYRADLRRALPLRADEYLESMEASPSATERDWTAAAARVIDSRLALLAGLVAQTTDPTRRP